jgi:gliding motility-associated-like protein
MPSKATLSVQVSASSRSAAITLLPLHPEQCPINAIPLIMKRLFQFVLFLLLAVAVNAQQVSIASGSATSCSGVIEDTGGPNGSYGDNESHTFVICPDVPGNVIYLTWFVFNLSTQGPNPIDNLTIYDGDNTGETTLGTYSGNALQDIVVSGTVFNTTGCLTLVFNSNGAGIGDFAAGFQCTVPCQNPFAIATMPEAVPALICQGEEVTFDGSASFAQGGQSIAQYLWDFDDGSVDSTSGPIVSHVFDDDGEHVVQLYITDDNDCRNLNLVDLQILVSTTPDFSTTSPDTTICFGESISFYGNADPVTWTGIPDANFGDGVFLPDDVGLPFISSLNFEQFGFGQLLTTIDDIESICVEMEHTFMGDLVLQVICPNGNSVILHQQGGGGTYLGAPNDFDSDEDPIFGECWEYCWAPGATNGTWIENLANTTEAGTPPNESLNPGTYESVQPMDQLVGCPLNGEWVYQSTDLWAADNGFICSWSINFNPDIIPDVTQFTPSWGAGADSSLWTGGTVPDVISANGDTITMNTPAPGDYPFIYQVTDNFGCTYDTTITLTVSEPFELEAGPDGVICNDPLQLNATVVGAATNCNWVLQMDDSWGDGWNGAQMTVTVNGTPTNYTCTGDQTIVNIPVTNGVDIALSYSPGTFENEVSYILFDDQGNIVFQAGPDPPVGPVWSGTASCDAQNGMVWQWTPTDGLSDPMLANPTVLVTSPTEYFVTAYPIGHPLCNATDSLMVTLDPGLDPGLDSLVVVCATPPSFQLIDMLAGTPEPGGVWTDSNGNVVPDVFDPVVDAAGTYTYTVTTGLGCVGTADLEIQILPASDPMCCGVVDSGPDSTICTLTYSMLATAGNTGVGAWSGPAGYTFADINDPLSDVTAPASGPAMFHWTEDDGVLCFLVDSVTITFTEPIVASVAVTDAICFSACDGTADASNTGGTAPFSYAWSDALAADTSYAGNICAGTYSLAITDVNGCEGNTDVIVGEPELLTIDSTSFVQPWCFAACDGSITITDAEAVEYSFDGGLSFQASATLNDVCAGTYDLQIKNVAGCIGTGMITVTEPPQVIAQFLHSPVPANVNDPYISFSNLSLNAVSYEWDFAGLGSSTDLDAQFLFSNKEPGIYPVCLVAADAHACTDTVCHDVIIDDVLFTYVPNTFTPDGDGVNELWGISSNIADITNFEMRVFDRWGGIVYETDSPYKPWNGALQNSGEILKQDVYAYRITFQLISTGAVRELDGHVTLLK